MQSDKEVVLAAVTQDAEAFDYASKELQNNKEVVLAAIMQLLMQYNIEQTDGDSAVDCDIGQTIHKLISKQVLVPLDVIHVVSGCGLHWNHGMSELVEQDYSVLECIDTSTGLLPFMTFASCSGKSQNDIDLNTLFEMVKRNPQAVRL